MHKIEYDWMCLYVLLSTEALDTINHLQNLTRLYVARSVPLLVWIDAINLLSIYLLSIYEIETLGSINLPLVSYLSPLNGP